MNSADTHTSSRKTYLVVGFLLLLVLAVGVGGLLSSDKYGIHSTKTTPSSSTPDVTKVKSVVSYTVPTGWQDIDCGNGNLYYLMAADSTADCNIGTNPNSLISVSIKDQYTDCNQIKPPTTVTRHVCSSLFIDGNKTLKTSTTYPQNANEAAKTTENYYVNTGKSVVRVQYVYHQDPADQMVFDELANSIKVNR